MGRSDHNAWLARVIAENPEAAATLPPVDQTPAATVDPAHEWIWRAWQRLHHDRAMMPVGMGTPFPGRIAWRDVMAWADRHDYGDDASAQLDTVIQALDVVYLDHETQRRKREAPPGNPAHRPR